MEDTIVTLRPEVLDSVLAPLGGNVTRRPARDVYAEIGAAAAKAG
jgi:hypothetical protein